MVVVVFSDMPPPAAGVVVFSVVVEVSSDLPQPITEAPMARAAKRVSIFFMVFTLTSPDRSRRRI